MCVSVQYVAELLHEQGQPIVSTCSAADVQAAFNTIVTRIQRLWVTYIHAQPLVLWHKPSVCDLVSRYLGLLLAKLCVFMVAPRQRIPDLYCSCCWGALYRRPFFDNVPVFLWWVVVSAFFSYSGIHPLGCHRLKLFFCYTFTLKMVLSLNQLKCNLSTLNTPAPLLIWGLQLGSCRTEPCTRFAQCCHSLSWLEDFNVDTGSAQELTISHIWVPRSAAGQV